MQIDRPQPQIAKQAGEPSSAAIEYKKLADSLGFRPAALSEHLLRELLFANHIPMYDYDAVHRYLVGLCPDWLIYVWRPLGRGMGVDRPRNHGEFSPVPYDKPVPIHILRRAVLLKGKCDELEFFVSDWANSGDPFLLVRLGRARRVIGQWDEPSFEGRPEV